nr:SAM-dependent methyltransferase [Streptomyces sp. SID3343]
MEIDFDRAHPARMYDYLLGGRTNFDADREAADRALGANPTLRVAARENRAFLLRVVDHVARSGVRQFVDVGTGIPIEGNNTHDVAQAVRSDARVVYVDNDPIVLAHAKALLAGDPDGRTAYIDGDLRDPGSIVEHPAFVETLRLDEPVALLLVAILHFVADDEDPASILRELTKRLPSGSRMVISHATADFDPVRWAGTVRAYADAGITVRPRSRSEIEALFEGWEIEEPGLLVLSDWRPAPGAEPVDPILASCYGAVARKL